MLSNEIVKTYEDILIEELQVAMGCTEPIAIAYAAAIARDALGKLPDKITVQLSGNIIKNVKSVINTLSVLFSAFMVVGRLVSGVHWFTDIVGSVLLSFSLFFVYKSVVLLTDKC